jgi:hypothetical protein
VLSPRILSGKSQCNLGEPDLWDTSLKLLNIAGFCAGIALLLAGLSFSQTDLLIDVGFPVRELSNPWIRGELATLRIACIVIAMLLIGSRIILWRYPQAVATFTNKVDALSRDLARSPLFIPLALTLLVLMKTVLQLGLHFTGYVNYAGDDFGRTLSAAYWLHYRKFDLGMDGWLGLAGSGWLPFSDYLFGLSLALHRDLFLTPKVVNLAISGITVIVVYFLGRELFDRRTGFLTAALFAFLPWHVWLGISGMTSDLPTVALIALFAVFFVRWLKTDGPEPFLAAAGCLGLANGFRYENWLYALVFSLLVVYIAALRWRRQRLERRWVIVAVCALVIVNVFPVGWMTASYIVLGDWLPAMHGINAFMVAGMAGQTTRTEAQMSIPLMALGSFPFEIVLSIAAIVLLPISRRSAVFRLYLVMLGMTILLFAFVFGGQLPAWLNIPRYLLSFIVLALPFAGFLIVQLFRAPPPWRNEGVVASCLIVLAAAIFDIGRSFNYPASFPKDAIHAGWAVRSLQNTGTIPEHGKILIERAEDWGDLGVVVLADRPERFVVLNEIGYRQTALAGLMANKPTAVVAARHEGVRGSACEKGFQAEACKDSVLQEGFRLVILSSPTQVVSFQEAFPVRSWNIGRYHIFDMNSSVSSGHAAAGRLGTNHASPQ